MEVYYKPSDIVWVKLGPFWWPGEVVDKTKVPEEIIESLKKEPVAFVKFFDDDEYLECVKTSDHIFHYNCDRKNGFIKKGMDAFRANNPKLTSFPKDVSTAEVKTGGNANILSEPMFTPEPKKNYGEIFGSPSPKKPKNGNKNRPNKLAPIITHRRFLGCDDYESHVLIQFPGKDKEFEDQDQPESISYEPYAKFTCPICHFVTDKLGILTIHTQGHVKDVVYIPGSHMKKTPKRKKKKALSDDEIDEKKTKIKRKYKKKAKTDQSSFADDERSENASAVEKDLSGGKIQDPGSMEKKDVCNDIIADWDDESNQDNTEEIDTSVVDTTVDSEMNTSDEVTVHEVSITKDSLLDSTFEPTEDHKFHSTLITEESDQAIYPELTEKTPEKKREKDSSVSCFDFDENEEDTRIPNATSGRKIPRVIPLSDKRKSFSLENDIVEDEEEELRKKILSESVQLAKESETQEKDEETEGLERTYKSLMESTSKIELPDFPNVLKNEQNFHCAKTVKYPDKDSNAISTSDDGSILLDAARKLDKADENSKYPEVLTESSPDIEESHKPNFVNESSLIVEQLCNEIDKKSEKEIDIFPVKDVKNDKLSERAKIDNKEVPSIKGDASNSKKQQKSIVESKSDKQLADTPKTIVRSKRKFETATECPKNSFELKEEIDKKTQHVEIDDNNEYPRKRSKKSKVSDVENLKLIEDSLDTKINKQVEEKSSKIDQPEAEKEIALEDYDKNKMKSKKESSKKKKGKKEKKHTLQKRHIDESEIDKLLAQYSAEPIKDDEESDYCFSELVSEVFVDSSPIPQSKSSEKDISKKSSEIEQLVSEREVESAQKPDPVMSEEKAAIESDIQNIKSEQKSEIAAATDSNVLKQKELNLDASQLDIIVEQTQMPCGENPESNESIAKNQHILDESSTTDLVSEVCSEQIVHEVELQEETLKSKVENSDQVSVKDGTSKRSSRRHKRSCQQEEDISIVNSESKASADERNLKDGPGECNPHLGKVAETPQVSGIGEKDLTVVEQETLQIPASYSTTNNESLSLVTQETKSRLSPKKDDRRSSKVLKKESSERDQQSSNKKEFDASVSSRRSTRRDRRSSSKHVVSTSQNTADLEAETVKIDDNMTKCDDSKVNEKEKLSKDPNQSETFSIDLKDDSSGSLKITKKSEKNYKTDELHKTESLKNAEPISSNQKESHRSLHKTSRSHKTSSRSNRDNKSSKRNDSVENVTPVVDQIEEPITSHRSSRSKSRHVDQKNEQSFLVDVHKNDQHSSKDMTLNVKSTEEDLVVHSSDKQKEKASSISQKEDRKSSQSSKSKRRSSKHDYEQHLESSTRTDITKSERSRSDKKDARSPYHRSKSDKTSNKILDKSSHTRGENLDIAHGSSSHHNYRRSRDHSEKHGDLSKNEKINRTKEKDITENILKTEKQDKVKRNASSIETEKIDGKHRSCRKERRSADDYNEKKQIESKPAESEKGDLHVEQQIDKKSVNLSAKHDRESKEDMEKVTEISVLQIQEEQKISLNINQTEKEIENKEITSNVKKTKSETIICQESEDGKCFESSVKDSDEKLEVFAKVGDVPEKDSIFQENSNEKENIGSEKIAEVSVENTEPIIVESSFTSISSRDNLSSLISAIVGADSSQELDQIKNEGVQELSDPVCDNSIDQITSGNDKKENSDEPAQSELNKKINNILNDGNQPSVADKQELSQKSRRNRKPSRWDQKERPSTIVDKKSKIGPWDQGNEGHTSQQQSMISDMIETLDNTKTFNSSNISEPETSVSEETEKSDDQISQKDSSVVSQQEAEQIELIFGSSPLPKPQEDNLFTEEENEELKQIDTNDIVQKKDPKKMFIMKSKLSEPVRAYNEKNDDKISTFECSALASDDLMESVESQVARITHYEEPHSQESSEEKQKHGEEQSMKESSFDTPEKKGFSKSIFDTPDDKIKVESGTPESKLSVEKKRPRLLEADLRTQKRDVTEEANHEKITPKSKKNYLLIEKSKLEKMDKSPESLTDLSSLPVHSSKSSKEKANEVATKLTNPKKRFVKSFEDFELNKQKEKSVDVPSSAEDKTKKGSTASGLVGKSPIVFKLKKQFLSKISNVFDEESEEMISANKAKTSTLVKSVSPTKVKELNSSLKSEDNFGNDNIKSISTSEIEADDNKSPIVPDDASQNENLKVSLSEVFSRNSDKIEVSEVESLIKADAKTGQEIEIQKNFAENSNSNQEHFEIDNSSAVEFSIDTNLSNIDNSQAVNEFTKPSSETRTKNEEETHVDDSKTEIITKKFPLENKNEESEFVPIDGNLTVVSEKELEEGQVEITATMSNKKPINLMNFSMDFSDDSSDTAFEVLKKENIRCITESLDVSKTLEVENKIVNAEGKTPQQVTENVSSESGINIIHDEESLHSAIIAQLDFNFDSATQKDDHQNITIENILETNLIKKNETVEIIPSSDSLSQFHVTTTSIKTSSKLSDVNLTKTPIKITDINTAKELEKAESVTPVKRTERKAVQKPKLNTAPANEPLVIYNTVKSSTITDMCDLEDHIPSQIVCTKNALINEEVMKVAGIGNELAKEGSLPKIEPPKSKLLNRLTGDKTKDESPKAVVALIESKKADIDSKNQKIETGSSKNLIKSSIKGQTLVGVTNTKSGNKAIILSEKIIRPARDAVLPNSQLKRSYEDIEDIKPYIISKTQKIDNKKGPEKILTTNSKVVLASSTKSSVGGTTSKLVLTNPNKQALGMPKFSGKAKILNQTIIRPASEILQAKAVSSVEDNIDFDINSMPIVLSDELLTPESLENMPIVLGDNIPKSSSTEKIKIFVDKKETHNAAKILNNSVTMPSSLLQSTALKTPQMKKATIPKILQTPAQAHRIIRQATSTKSGKLIFVPENSSKVIQTKKPNIVRRSMPLSGVTANPQNVTPEPTGHKIMIVTNQQGQQQRLLLTPAHQKMFGMQLPKAGKTIMKSGVALKTPVGKVPTNIAGNLISSKVQGQGVTSTKFIKAPVSSGQIISPQIKLAPPRKVQKVYMPNQQTTKVHPQKTILIKNHQGQTVKKVQGTDEALLDKQVAEQIEAIKVSSLKSLQRQQELVIKTSVSKPGAIVNRKSYSKRPELRQTLISQPKMTVQSTVNVATAARASEQVIPALTPIKVDKKPEETQKLLHEVKPIENKPVDRPLNQLVIQDNMGNQTTVTEGQILALPSETVDGQPQSYMLVTLDESGNLTPLNNEALMSLDPSLAGGDLSNMVLQLDPGLTKDGGSHTAQLQAVPPTTNVQEKLKTDEMDMSRIVQEVQPKPIDQVLQPIEQTTAQVQVTCNINGEPSQQIILTGDPLATQKFLDSLSEGNTDLANILANAEGSSFLIQADGQQILINTEPTDAQMLQANSIVAEQPDQGNPMFATHPVKNQDILAAALADTDVFQQEQISNQNKVMHSQLSPGQTLFPMNVGNVLETSLTLNSPIMTPLEVPSTNSKKIVDAESDILTARVPKNVDLPITITDPNISQTVSHQQVLLASDLQANLELTLPISETAMSVTSGMNSPSFVYSLPNLGVTEHTEVNQKSFSSSMPLLTEDIEETPHHFPSTISQEGDESTDSKLSGEVPRHGLVDSIDDKRPSIIASDSTYIEEGLCTLGGEMCNSLSEPPPEMFDIPISNDSLNFLNNKSENICKENLSTSVTLTPELLADENSMEIPVQPRIVADLKDPPHTEDSFNSTTDEKECKLD